jgi:hypothetical protein
MRTLIPPIILTIPDYHHYIIIAVAHLSLSIFIYFLYITIITYMMHDVIRGNDV